jgi:hypothetical protein
MSASADAPVIYEVNTAVWLGELSRARGELVRLGDVEAEAWNSLTPTGVDAVWLMGVWTRSPAGLRIAEENGELQADFRRALPDLQEGDVIGSPYCVREYSVDPSFGGPAGLASARAALVARGVGLFLDYVPNHVAPDHPSVTDHPEWFIRGSDDDLRNDPPGWLATGGSILAHGRDPYFPPWPDVVQLNAFSDGMRQATVNTLADIAAQCDGIRCDMAMLLTNEVFARTWGERAGPLPTEEFWPSVIAELRQRHPSTSLVAEAYWDMEWTLQQQGFDFCYDKRLYDRIVDGEASAVREHLQADIGYQARLLRFLENHDEPRVASRLQPDQERAAAVLISTLPGATMWHDGQFERRQVRVPVFLTRRPAEADDVEMSAWYKELLAALRNSDLRAGDWLLAVVEGWPDNQSCHNLLAWTWTNVAAGEQRLVVVNYSGAPAQGRVRLPWGDVAGRTWQLHDLLDGADYERAGGEMASEGLFVDLKGWGCHLLDVQAG